MEIDVSSEYGRRVNANVRVLALIAIAVLGILLAFNSGNGRHINHSDATDTTVGYVFE